MLGAPKPKMLSQIPLPPIEALRASAELELKAGIHRANVAAGQPLELEIVEGTRAQVSVALERLASGSSALALGLVLAPVARLRLQLKPTTLHTLRQLVPAQFAARLDELALRFEGFAPAVGLEIARLKIDRSRGDGVDVRLWGAVRLLDQLALPIPGIRLPARLSSPSSPLATRLTRAIEAADLHTLTRTLLDIVQRGVLKLDLSLEPLELDWRHLAADGTETRTQLATKETRALTGEFQLATTDAAFELSCPCLRLCGSSSGPASTVGLRLASHAEAPPSDSGARLEVHLAIDEAASLPPLALRLERRHALVAGGSNLELQLAEVLARGRLAASWSPCAGSPIRTEGSLSLGARMLRGSTLELEERERHVKTTLEGQLELEATSGPRQDWHVNARTRATLDHTFGTRIAPIAELGLLEGVLSGTAQTALDLDLRGVTSYEPRQGARLDLTGSRASLTLQSLAAWLDRCRLTLPPSTFVAGEVRRGGLEGEHLEPWEIDLSWDLDQKPCLLARDNGAGEEQVVSLLTTELRQGRLTLRLNEHGRLSFGGAPDALYGERYFNALIDPAGDVIAWYQILSSDDAFAHVEGAVGLFSRELVDLLRDARQLLITAREIGRRERLRHAGDVIPRQRLARVLSLLLVGTPRLEAEIAPVVARVTDGDGLPLGQVRQLLERELGPVANTFELGALLNWLDLLLRPGPASDASNPREEPPLPLDPALAAELGDLPSARQLYEMARLRNPPPDQIERLCQLAPLLRAEQLDYVLEQADPAGWPEERLAQLRAVARLKRRVAGLAEAYGGIAHAAQSRVIALFLGSALAPPCPLIGPEELAILLRAGLATARQGRRTQLNNRLLLELLRTREPELTRAVLVELSQQSPRALANLLYSFLEQDQDKLVTPLDLPELLGEKLGFEVPRQADFLAGGRRARESYYQNLSALADRVIASADGYLARKQHLQQVRHPPAPPLRLDRSLEAYEQRAMGAVEAADRLGHESLGKLGARQRRRARASYEDAFARCRELLAHEPRAFQRPWLRRFWQRNEEALRVLSLVRACQGDVDSVRHWLTVRRGRVPSSEPALLRASIEALYVAPPDRQRLLGDPLVRLLVEPPAGHYDFTIVSCMGVITDGERGAELEHAYRRLSERRGIRIIRTSTGTGRPLEYNARRIIEAIGSCTTPYGLLGYSQGCANALLAESLLRGGTPEEQALLERLVCRNLLFSSANGSAHATSGMLKFTQAMVAGERLLKHYQASYSWEAIRAVLRGLRATLDAPLFVTVLGSTHSLSFERARELHRDGQFVDSVPSSSSCAVVTADRLPEALEYTYNVLRVLSRGAEQDTQVLLADARPAATRVANDFTRAFARSEIGAFPQATHHWAPLTHEVRIVMTERDRELGIYESPTDQLVGPWIETNARLGRIRRL